ncbi:uncharacterized protein C8Q71DRAFT_439540 [Rhodofomes roseus]|uniref:F-box domain-containing protein n=1 Tax=Rhodofomes roseus TaxID=34475 RepID=A0ABQ8KR58_9APHY|nr:uncharacterized protein C8Q71DRAFT_439540 [Rhodofomes roseus]KAH9841116.1 hypothetical protein C8Q71DRAFT_439540 [Rhodofomes roseus]
MKEGVSTGTAAFGGSPQDAPAPRLPTEICGRIIDHVAAGLDIVYSVLDGNPHLLALQSCALVCRDWYYHTWYHLRQRVHLRDRDDIRLLSRTLRDRPRLRGVVQQVVISGHAQQSVVQHLELFTAMLAGKLPALSRIAIEDVEWTVGSMRMEGFGYLATFNLVHTLEITDVTVPSIAQLARLISALHGLSFLRFFGVDCSQNPPASLVSLPLNSANLESLEVRWAAPAVEDFLVRIIQEASRVHYLAFGVDGNVDIFSMGSRSQTLLDASAASVEALKLIIPNILVSDGTVDAIVERHYNLSRLESLWHLEITLPYYPFVAWSWIPHIISRVTSKHLMAMSIVFTIRANHAADDVDGALTMMEEDNILVRLDDMLQTECFANIAPGGVCLGFDHIRWLSYGKLSGTESSFRERCNQWDELMMRKLVVCNGRGILTTAHGKKELLDWRVTMNSMHTKTQHRKTKTGGGAQGEDQPEHTPDTPG